MSIKGNNQVEIWDNDIEFPYATTDYSPQTLMRNDIGVRVPWEDQWKASGACNNKISKIGMYWNFYEPVEGAAGGD